MLSHGGGAREGLDPDSSDIGAHCSVQVLLDFLK